MEFALDELYRRDIQTRGGDFLTFATFRALGGLEGAIAAQAEATVAALPPAVAGALPVLVRALVLVGDDDRVGARAAPLTELQATPELAGITDALVAARLVVVSGATVRVAHEALLRAWPRAQALIALDLDLLRARARAEQAMARWQAEKDAADFLLPRGRSLAEAQELLDARRNELGHDLVRFIEASAAADEDRRQAELAAERARAEAEADAARQREQRAIEQAAAAHRLTRRTRIAAGILGVLLLIAVGTGIFAAIQRTQAVRQRNAALVSQSHFLADAASAAIESGDSRLGRLLALMALPKTIADPDRPYVAAAEAALAQSWPEDRLIAIDAPPPAKTAPPAPAAATAPVAPGAATAPGATTGPAARHAQLLLSILPRLDTMAFAFSTDGERMLLSGEGHARVYDGANTVLVDAPHAADKGAAVLNGDGSLMAQGDDATGLFVIDAAGSRVRTLLASSGLTGGAVSPDGKTAAVTVNGSEVALVPFAGGAIRTIHRAPAGDTIAFADFTARSGRLVVQHQSYAALMLDPATGRVIGPLADGKQKGLGFVGHSDAMVAWWEDGRTVLYNPDGGSLPIATPQDPNNLTITRIVGNGDANLLATVGRTGSAVFFWDMTTGKLAGRADDQQTFSAFAVAFMPGPGGWIAQGSANQNVLVWGWPDTGMPDIVGAPRKRLLGHTGVIRRMRVTPQGRLMSEADDQAAILWDPLHGHAITRYDGVINSRLSADGNRFVFIGADGAVRIAQLPPSGQALIDAARQRYGDLSRAELARYFLSAEINRD